jgi:hypothetical protein
LVALRAQWLSCQFPGRNEVNVLLSYASGKDKAEGAHYLRVMQRMGHQVFRIGLANDDTDVAETNYVEAGYGPSTSLDAMVDVAGFPPDLFLYIDPGRFIPPGLESAPFPTACILCDTHRDLKARLLVARFFDHVFLYHRNYLPFFVEHPLGHIHWLPYACDLEYFRPSAATRDLDVAFIGKLICWSSERKGVLDDSRQRIMERIGRHWKTNELRYYRQAEIPEIYSRAKIVLNMPLADDLNFRTFEAMSCGAMLLTRRVDNGQEILFEEDEHFAAFSDEDELLEKLAYYLSHAEERRAIADAGLKEVRQHHRLDSRIQQLFDFVVENPRLKAPLRQMSLCQVDRCYAQLYAQLRLVDPMLSLVGRARRAGRPWLQLCSMALQTFGRRVKNGA